MKLGVGTVQFGMNYGISNKDGQTKEADVFKILAQCEKNNIQFLDTAPQYGDSEEILGKALHETRSFKITTKVSKFGKSSLGKSDATMLRDNFFNSLSRLQQQKTYGLLLHHAEDLLVPGGEYLYDALLDLKEKKHIEKIGVSIYTAKEIDGLLEKYTLDLIQLPINVFDQRLLYGGYLKQLKQRDIEVHARSVFLQGLLLMSIDDMPPYFVQIKEHISRYHAFLKESHLTPLEASLGFALSIPEVDVVICGVNSYEQFQDLIQVRRELNIADFCEYRLTNHDRFLNPAEWVL